jgi:hypothetical protein
MALILGIDTGVHGAVAVLSGGEMTGVVDLPIHRSGSVVWADALELQAIFRELCVGQRNHVPMRAYVETIHFVRKGGVLHSPVILGSVLAALQVWGCPIAIVQAAVWKRHFGLLMPGASDTKRKAASLEQARLLFPAADLERVKDHNRAEALLIAAYGQSLWASGAVVDGVRAA